MAAKVIALHAGPIQTHGRADAAHPYDRPWDTAFFKQPLAGPVLVTRLGLFGDDQQNKKYHGGPDQALLVYSAEHYPKWQTELGRPEFLPGGFAENLTVTNQDESTVCLGDTYRIGEKVTVQVTAPRAPCSKIDRRWKTDGLARRVGQLQRTGWYLRVLTEGTITEADPLALLSRPHPDITIARVLTVHDHHRNDYAQVKAIVDCEELAPRYRESLLG